MSKILLLGVVNCTNWTHWILGDPVSQLHQFHCFTARVGPFESVEVTEKLTLNSLLVQWVYPGANYYANLQDFSLCPANSKNLGCLWHRMLVSAGTANGSEEIHDLADQASIELHYWLIFCNLSRLCFKINMVLLFLRSKEVCQRKYVHQCTWDLWQLKYQIACSFHCSLERNRMPRGSCRLALAEDQKHRRDTSALILTLQ